jgi:hypothetical protein
VTTAADARIGIELKNSSVLNIYNSQISHEKVGAGYLLPLL